ncbi:hypothetical protein ACE38W_01080 [Chitinophaga sp. Hz27]|uniref:hypothetical protein n=1 Tax=Chitinophaga sp. Hz27 TaxID=3347169 RepID=UPI0035DC2594
MKKLRTALPFCIVMSMSISALAQHFTAIKSELEHGDYWHNFYTLGNDKIICLEYASPHNAFNYNRNFDHSNMIVLDTNLNVIKEKEIPELEKKILRASYPTSDKLYLAYEDKNDQISLYQINDKDHSAILKEDLFKVSADDRKMSAGASDNYKYFLCKSYQKKETGTFDLVIFDQEMKIKKQITYHDKHSKDDIENIQYDLSDNGTFYIITHYRLSKKDKLNVEITTIKDKNDIKTVSLPSLNADIDSPPTWRLIDDKYVMIVERYNKKEVSGYFIGQYDIISNKMSEIKSVSLEKPIPENAYWRYLHYGNDGSIYLYYDIMTEKRWFTNSGHSGTDYYSAEAFAFKINPDGKVGWQHTIVKNQFEQQAHNHTGSVITMDNDDMYIFFTDWLDNTTVSNPDDKKIRELQIMNKMPKSGIACVYISKDGKAEKKFVTTDETEAHHLAIDAYRVSNGQLIYTAFQQKNIGRSTYKIGKINWKN